MKKITLSFFKFLLAFVFLYLAGAFINKFGMLIYAFSVLLLSIPIFLNNASIFSLKKEIKVIEYEKSKKFYNFLSGKTFGYIFIIAIALILSFIIPVRIYLFSSIEFLCIIIIFPLLILARYISKKIILAIYNNKYATYKIENTTYIITSFLLSIIFPIISYFLKDININIAFLDNDINTLQHNYIAYIIGSFINFFDNIVYSITNTEVIRTSPLWFFLMVLIILGGNSFIFYGIVSFMSFFFIKKENLVKVFMPVKDYENTDINKFIVYFITTLLIVFIYPSIFASVTYISFIKQDIAKSTIKANTIAVEVINGVMYKAGTLNQIEIAKNKIYGMAKDDVIEEINTVYNEIILNTDKYLDWYYSLSAEYTRIFELITGSIEKYMTDKLKENLMDNVTDSINIKSVEKNIKKLENEVNNILENNKITKKDKIYTVTSNININNIYDIVDIKPLLDFQNRIIASTGGGLVVSSIVGVISSKVAAKTGFKTATKAIAKTVVGKAMSASAGAIAGAISSILTSPVGGIAIGTATGVAIDKGLLKLEELVNRNEYKKEIIESIEENRQNMLDMINKQYENQ